MAQENHGIPSLRAFAFVVTNDPGLYFKDHFGCVAYSWRPEPIAKRPENLGEESMPYVCCNAKIEDFNLTASRIALLRALILSNYSNLDAFIATLTCK